MKNRQVSHLRKWKKVVLEAKFHTDRNGWERDQDQEQEQKQEQEQEREQEQEQEQEQEHE